MIFKNIKMVFLNVKLIWLKIIFFMFLLYIFLKLIKCYFGDERGSVFCDNIDDKNLL